MTETSSLRPGDAIKPDGFVDFYELLGADTHTSTDVLRERINALYSEAQANRDHRNLNKRRDYELLLELLPFARTVLLDADKRRRYDAYADDARAGLAGSDFETFMDTLTGKADNDAEERASLLGVAESGTRDTAPSASKNGAVAPSAKPVTDLPRPTSKAATPPTSNRVSSQAQAGLMGSALSVGVFFIGLVIGGLALHNWPIGLVAGGILGAITWFVTHKKANKVA